ncbi:MAG: peptidylprolyl isomerase [Planctomycetota bacterium]|nr:peptidylprolyl isomerase [Planctomycetota bacterium]
MHKLQYWTVGAMALIGCLSAETALAQAPAADPDDVYLRIGDREVTRREYEDYLLNKFGGRALERFVGDRLVLAEAAKRGVEATEEERADWVARMIRRNREDPNFFPWLQGQGIDLDSYEGQVLPEEAAVQVCLEKMVREDRSSAEGLQEMYQRRYGIRYHTRVILVREDAALSQEAHRWARDKILEAKGRLEAGESFDSLAQELSESADSPVGGDLGFFRAGRFDPALEEAAFSLAEGEIMGPVESEYGYHLIQTMEKRKDEVRARHILIRSYKELSKQPGWLTVLYGRLDPKIRENILEASRRRAARVLKDLGMGADFATVAAQESSHGSSRRGGEIPPVRLGGGTLPARVEAALAKMKKGELSSPVEGDLGHYILRLDDRSGEERPFEEVKEALRMEAVEGPVPREALTRFVQSLREGIEVVISGEERGTTR